MSIFTKVDTMQGDYYAHCCPECGKAPEFANCGSDGQILYCPTDEHKEKFCVDTPTIEQTVKEWNGRCARYELAKGMRRISE